MNATALASTRSMHASHGGTLSSFAALLRKDLRLARIAAVPSAATLAILSIVAAAAPLLGDRAMEALGLQNIEGQGALDRIGQFALGFWLISLFACILSALAIAGGDNAGRARQLLSVLPVSMRMAYASKACACGIVVAAFLCMSAAVQSMTTDAGLIEPTQAFAYGAVLAIGVVWSFATPLFVRTFGGALVVMTTVPMLLFLACSIVGEAVAGFAVRHLLSASDAAYWFGDGILATAGDGGVNLSIHGLSIHGLSIHGLSLHGRNAAWTCAGAVVLAMGLWCAWQARRAVLCTQSVRGFDRRGVIHAVACVGTAVGCSGVGSAALLWRDEPAIAHVRMTEERLESFRNKPVGELVGLWASHWGFVDRLRERLFERSETRRGFKASFWPVVTQESAPSVVSLDPEERIARRAMMLALRERLASDPEGVRTAAQALLDEDQSRSPIEQVRIAELIGPRARASVLLRRLASAHWPESERVDLIMLLTPSLTMLDPGWDNMSSWEGRPGDWLAGVDRQEWRLAPFQLDCSGEPRSCPSASARAEAVVFVTVLEQRIEAGTFEIVDPRAPHDRLSVGKAVLRAARQALEPSFPQLADRTLADSPWLKDATRAPSVTDDQSLYLPASLLFDRAKTDPAYLLPTD